MKLIYLLLLSILFHCCRMNETKSDNHSFLISINDTLTIDSIDIIMGRKELLKIKNKNIWKIELDGVRGGYSELFGKKYKEVNGDKSKRIFFYSKSNIFKSYSYDEILYLNNIKFDTFDIYLIE